MKNADGSFTLTFPTTPSEIALIGHELTHSVQYKILGKFSFAERYLGDYVRNRLSGMDGRQAYENIPFEREANAVQDALKTYIKEKFGEHPCECIQ